MADRQLYTNEAAVAKAGEIITALALSFLHFFKSGFVPTRFTTKAELVAQVCDFDGYPPAGYPLTAWTGPILENDGGAVITSPLVNPAYGTPSVPPVGNDIGGWWVEDASGDVRVVGIYDPARPIQGPSQGFPFVVQIVEARNILA